MADKPRRSKRDDDDFGMRTPSRKSSSKSKKESGKRRRPTGEHKRAEKPVESEKPAAKPKKADTGKHRKSELAPPAVTAGSFKLITAGLAAAVAIGAILSLVMMGGDDVEVVQATPNPINDTIPIAATSPTPKQEVEQPKLSTRAEVKVNPRVNEPVPLEPPSPPPTEAETNLLEELASRSADHAELARILEELQDLYNPGGGLPANPGPMFENFQERQRREQELIDRIRSMGPAMIGALTDMLLELDNRHQKIFLGKALAGMDDPEAMKAVAKILSEVKDVALQTTLARNLPDSPGATEVVGNAIASEGNPNLRCMLLREYARRLGDNDPGGGTDVFRQAALEDSDPNVRAEAVTLIGRRGNSTDASLMEEIISNEQNLQIRQRAIVSYAETGREGSLDFLENMARQESTPLAIRASAVLAIGRVGGERAIQSLDHMAQTDPSQEIRTRANRLAQSLRRRQQEASQPPDPLRTDPRGYTPPTSEPIEKRQ